MLSSLPSDLPATAQLLIKALNPPSLIALIEKDEKMARDADRLFLRVQGVLDEIYGNEAQN